MRSGAVYRMAMSSANRCRCSRGLRHDGRATFCGAPESIVGSTESRPTGFIAPLVNQVRPAFAVSNAGARISLSHAARLRLLVFPPGVLGAFAYRLRAANEKSSAAFHRPFAPWALHKDP